MIESIVAKNVVEYIYIIIIKYENGLLLYKITKKIVYFQFFITDAISDGFKKLIQLVLIM